MKINVDAPIRFRDGTPLIDEAEKPILLSFMCRMVLNSITSDDPAMKKITPEEIMRRGKLAMRLSEGGMQDFELKDIAFIQDLVVAKARNAEVAMIVHEMLETEHKDGE